MNMENIAMRFQHQSPTGFQIESFAVGPFQCNCSLLWDTITQEALVIDPGDDFPRIQAHLQKQNLKVKAILHTHAHLDHVGASLNLRKMTLAPLALHPQDRFLWEHIPMQGQFFGLKLQDFPAWQVDLNDEQIFNIGSCSFLLENILFSGDTLFQGSIGRTDLWGGNFSVLSHSIKERLYTLDSDTLVICGHGPHTKIGVEKKENPFVTV